MIIQSTKDTNNPATVDASRNTILVEFFRDNDICSEVYPLFFNQQALPSGQLLLVAYARVIVTRAHLTGSLGREQPGEIVRINSAGSMARSPLRNERSGRWLGKSRITELAKLSNYQSRACYGNEETNLLGGCCPPSSSPICRQAIAAISNFARAASGKRDRDNVCYRRQNRCCYERGLRTLCENLSRR